jgi:hypothetical protein
MGNLVKKWIEMLLRICCEHIGNLGMCKNPSENLMIWYEIEVLLGMAYKTF